MPKFYNSLNSLPYAEWHRAKHYLSVIAMGADLKEIKQCIGVVSAYEAKGQIKEALHLAKGVLSELANPEHLPYCELYEVLLTPESKIPLEKIKELPMSEVLEALQAFDFLSG